MRTLTVLDSFHAAFTEPWKRRIDEQSWLALLWSVSFRRKLSPSPFSTFSLSRSISLPLSLTILSLFVLVICARYKEYTRELYVHICVSS